MRWTALSGEFGKLPAGLGAILLFGAAMVFLPPPLLALLVVAAVVAGLLSVPRAALSRTTGWLRHGKGRLLSGQIMQGEVDYESAGVLHLASR